MSGHAGCYAAPYARHREGRMTYLPDTNAVSAYMRGDSPRLVQKMRDSFGELCLSVIVLAEREFGVTKEPMQRIGSSLPNSRTHSRWNLSRETTAPTMQPFATTWSHAVKASALWTRSSLRKPCDSARPSSPATFANSDVFRDSR